MPSESYWLQLEAEARTTAAAWNLEGAERWVRLADLYRENAEKERKRVAGQTLGDR